MLWMEYKEYAGKNVYNFFDRKKSFGRNAMAKQTRKE